MQWCLRLTLNGEVANRKVLEPDHIKPSLYTTPGWLFMMVHALFSKEASPGPKELMNSAVSTAPRTGTWN